MPIPAGVLLILRPCPTFWTTRDVGWHIVPTAVSHAREVYKGPGRHGSMHPEGNLRRERGTATHALPSAQLLVIKDRIGQRIISR